VTRTFEETQVVDVESGIANVGPVHHGRTADAPVYVLHPAHLFRDCRSSQVLDRHTVPDAGNLKRATSVKRKALALHHGKDDWELRRAHPARGGLRSRTPGRDARPRGDGSGCPPVTLSLPSLAGCSARRRATLFVVCACIAQPSTCSIGA